MHYHVKRHVKLVKRLPFFVPALLGTLIIVTIITTLSMVDITNTYLRRTQAAESGRPFVPHPVVVMDGFDIDRSTGAGTLGQSIYDETRSTINVAIGDLEPRVQSGQITRDRANELISQFKSENGGKLYVERVQATLNGKKDPDTMVAYWSPYLDNYDGIFINEYTDSTTRDGQSQDAIETLRRIREKYPNKIIMPALVEAVGFSGQQNPFFNNETRSYQQFLEATAQYTDLVFYEFFLYTGQDEYGFFDMTKSSLGKINGLLSKTFYGLYIPQTVDTILDDKGVDVHPNKSISYHFQRQFQTLKTNFPEIAGIGYWVYYRSTPHIMKTVNWFTKNCYLGNNCGNLQAANLLQNGNFDSYNGFQFASWTSTNFTETSKVDYSTTPICNELQLYGSSVWCRYMNLWGTGVSLNSQRIAISQTVPVETNTSYYVKAYFRPENTPVKPTIKLKFNTGLEIVPDLPQIPYESGTGNKWKVREVWFTTPANASSATVTIENVSESKMYVDGVRLEKIVYPSSELPSLSSLVNYAGTVDGSRIITQDQMSATIIGVSPWNGSDSSTIRVKFATSGPVKWVNLKVDGREVGGVLQTTAAQGYIDFPANHQFHTPGTHALSIKPYDKSIKAGQESTTRYVTIRTNAGQCATAGDTWYSCNCPGGGYGGFCYPSQPESRCSCGSYPTPTPTPSPMPAKNPRVMFLPGNSASPQVSSDAQNIVLNFTKNEDVNYVNLVVDGREEWSGTVVQNGYPINQLGNYSLIFPSNHPRHTPGLHTLGLHPFYCNPANSNECKAGSITETAVTVQ